MAPWSMGSSFCVFLKKNEKKSQNDLLRGGSRFTPLQRDIQILNASCDDNVSLQPLSLSFQKDESILRLIYFIPLLVEDMGLYQVMT